MAYADIPEVRSWTINEAGAIHPYGSSDTGGFTARVSGIDDWTATIVANYVGAGPTITWGGTLGYNLKFYENGTVLWSGVGIVDGIDVNCPINDGGIIEITYSIGGHGTLTDATGTGTAPLSSTSGDVEYEAVA